MFPADWEFYLVQGYLGGPWPLDSIEGDGVDVGPR